MRVIHASQESSIPNKKKQKQKLNEKLFNKNNESIKQQIKQAKQQKHNILIEGDFNVKIEARAKCYSEIVTKGIILI